MDEIISYKMCAVKVRNAKLRNYLKLHCAQMRPTLVIMLLCLTPDDWESAGSQSTSNPGFQSALLFSLKESLGSRLTLSGLNYSYSFQFYLFASKFKTSTLHTMKRINIIL